MELRESKKWRNKYRRNRHELGHLPISKVEILTENATWRNIWKVDGSIKGGSASDKFRISGGNSGANVSITGQKLFCAKWKHRNENDRRYCRRLNNLAEELHGYAVGGANCILWGWNMEAGLKYSEENRKGSWCKGGAHHCGHYNQGTTSWHCQTIHPGVFWGRCYERYLKMQIHLQTDENHGKKWAGHLNYDLNLLDCTGNLGYEWGLSYKKTHQSYHPINS